MLRPNWVKPASLDVGALNQPHRARSGGGHRLGCKPRGEVKTGLRNTKAVSWSARTRAEIWPFGSKVTGRTAGRVQGQELELSDGHAGERLPERGRRDSRERRKQSRRRRGDGAQGRRGETSDALGKSRPTHSPSPPQSGSTKGSTGHRSALPRNHSGLSPPFRSPYATAVQKCKTDQRHTFQNPFRVASAAVQDETANFDHEGHRLMHAPPGAC